MKFLLMVSEKRYWRRFRIRFSRRAVPLGDRTAQIWVICPYNPSADAESLIEIGKRGSERLNQCRFRLVLEVGVTLPRVGPLA